MHTYQLLWLSVKSSNEHPHDVAILADLPSALWRLRDVPGAEQLWPSYYVRVLLIIRSRSGFNL
jgi:hypothetical protein